MDRWSQFYLSPVDLGHTKLERRQKNEHRVSYDICVFVCACVHIRACVFKQILLLYCSTVLQTTPVFLSISIDTTAWYAPSAVSGGWRCFTKLIRTCDADFGRPLRGAIKHALFDLLHLGYMGCLDDAEDFLNELKDLWFVPLTDLHAIF